MNGINHVDDAGPLSRFPEAFRSGIMLSLISGSQQWPSQWWWWTGNYYEWQQVVRDHHKIPKPNDSLKFHFEWHWPSSSSFLIYYHDKIPALKCCLSREIGWDESSSWNRDTFQQLPWWRKFLCFSFQNISIIGWNFGIVTSNFFFERERERSEIF